jgi:uncharacterized membrane protein
MFFALQLSVARIAYDNPRKAQGALRSAVSPNAASIIAVTSADDRASLSGGIDRMLIPANGTVAL